MFAAISDRATAGATPRAIAARTVDISIGAPIVLRTLPALLLIGLLLITLIE